MVIERFYKCKRITVLLFCFYQALKEPECLSCQHTRFLNGTLRIRIHRSVDRLTGRPAAFLILPGLMST